MSGLSNVGKYQNPGQVDAGQVDATALPEEGLVEATQDAGQAAEPAPAQVDGSYAKAKHESDLGAGMLAAKLGGAAATKAPAAKPTVKATGVRSVGTAAPVAAPRTVSAPATPRHAPGPPFGSPEFNRLLDRETHSVNRPNNKLTMLYDGVNSFAERKKMIQGAKESISMQTFIFTDDETGWDTARDLVDAAKRGVKVRLIYDGLGSNRADKRTKDDIFDFMEKNGVEVREYGDPLRQFWDVNNRWHEKYLVVDGKEAITGGMNIADEYAFGGSGRLALRRPKESQTAWRDADVKMEGPSVGDMQAAFFKNWGELGKPAPRAEQLRLIQRSNETSAQGGPNVRFVQHKPDEEGDQNTHQLMLQSIKSADKSITIENAYFNPPKDIRDALIAAAKRGVDVKVMTNSKKTNDMGAVSDAARYFYDDMIKAGVKVYERQTSTLHSKTATFDGQFSLVGSMNLNGRSEKLDSEGVMATEDPALAKSLEKRFAEGLKETKQVTKDELKKESFWTNAKQWALSLFSWTF